MGWTKRQMINEAYGELALQGYEFDLSPEEVQTALRRMDTMVATWEAKGVRIGYAFPSSPADSDPDADSGIPDSAVEAVYMNLAVRLAASNGKQLQGATSRTARQAYDTLLWAAAQPIQQQLPSTLPRGAGNRIWRSEQSPFFPAPCDSPLAIEQGGDLQILPE